MSERNKIEDRIRRKQAEIITLEDKLKAAKVYIGALRDILKLYEPDGDKASPDAKLKSGSSVDQARAIIVERGEPVHVDDLLKSMGKEANQANRSSLVGSLAAYVRREEIFTRTAPNTFGLIELDHTEADPSILDGEPPEGFGRAPVATGGWGSGAAEEVAEEEDDIPF